MGLFLEAAHETFVGSQPVSKRLVSIVSLKLLLSARAAPSFLLLVLLVLGAGVPPASLGGVPCLPAVVAPWRLALASFWFELVSASSARAVGKLVLPLALVGSRQGTVSFAFFFFLLFSSPFFASVSKLSLLAVGKLLLPPCLSGREPGDCEFPLGLLRQAGQACLVFVVAESCFLGSSLCCVLQALLALSGKFRSLSCSS